MGRGARRRPPAATLEEGCRWVEERVGAPMEPGGRHADFGTHNRLLSLGPDSYLEVIAVDPGAPLPDRPRWFELDTPQLRSRLAAGPALIHWVVRVNSVEEIENPLELSRGDNRWVIGVPADGRMPLGGLAPSRILWRTPPPSTTLPDTRVRLGLLTLGTPQQRALHDAIADVDAPVVVREGPEGMAALLDTPLGAVTLAG